MEIEKRHDNSSVSLLTEHLVITTKYRGGILKGEVAVECQRIIENVCQENDIKIIELAIETEHVHLLLQHSPKLSMSKIVEKIKSVSSFKLRRKYPHLVEWCPKAFWSRGFHAVSIGHGHEAVQKYIQSQGQERHSPSGARTANFTAGIEVVGNVNMVSLY